MEAVSVTRLRPEELDEALVLARLGSSQLDAHLWRLEVLDSLADISHGGVLIGRRRVGGACGLLIYRIAQQRGSAPSLEVDRLIAFDLMRPREIADALIAEAIRLARLQDCASLRLIRPLDAPEAATALVLASGISDLHSVF